MSTTGQVLLSDAIFLSVSGEGRRLRELADVSVCEVAAAAGTDVLTLLRWETGQLAPAGPQAGDWAWVVRVLRHRTPVGIAEQRQLSPGVELSGPPSRE